MKEGIDLISSSITLPNGVRVPNRLIKAAMEEGIGQGGGLPGLPHRRLYQRWADGEWGMIITGNVQVDSRILATGHDRTFPPNSPKAIEAWSQIASIITESPKPALAIIQISHAGLQSPSINFSRPPWSRPVAPVSARPDLGSTIYGWILSRILWPVKSRVVEGAGEWLKIVDRFVEVAKDAETAGWNGVQVHSAHGYLLAEYLSVLTNPSPVPLPGAPSNIPVRLHLLYLILTGISKATQSSFIKAVKVNCSDFVQGGLDEEEATKVVREIISWGLVDVLEVSGGTYASPTFAALDAITRPHPTRQSLFSHFTSALLPTLPLPPHGPAIILTGGLHSRELIIDSLRTRSCDLVGIGRPACLQPTLPRDVILNVEIEDHAAHVGGYNIPGGERMKRILGGGPTIVKSDTDTEPPAATYLETETDPLLTSSKKKEVVKGIPLIGAGVSTFWHEWQMARIGRGMNPDPGMSWFWGGLVVEGVWWGMLGGGPIGWLRK